MSALKESGVNLQQRLLSTEQPPVEDEEEEEQIEEKGFFSRWIIDPIASVFRAIWSVITWPFEKLFGPTAQEEQMDEEMVELCAMSDFGDH